MSLNLHCDQIDLWQTPTYITQMCMSMNNNREPDGGMEAVRRRYLMWVGSHTNGHWKNHEDFEAMKQRVEEHINKVLAIKNPEFYIV